MEPLTGGSTETRVGHGDPWLRQDDPRVASRRAAPGADNLQGRHQDGDRADGGARATYGGPIAARTFAAFYAAIDALVSQGCTVVAEAAFHREWFAMEIEPFRSKADLRVVVCDVPRHVAHQRYRSRAESSASRRFAHPDEVVLREMADKSFPWEAYFLGDTGLPTLIVDTGSDYRPVIEDILRFISEP